MILDDITTMIAGRLGQRTDINAMIQREVRQAQSTLEKTPPYPWFLAVRRLYDWSAQEITLPDDFIETIEDIIYIRKKTSDTTYLSPPAKILGGQMEHVVEGESTTGIPENFVLTGENLYLYPAPDVSYSILLPYYAKQTTLDSGTSTNLWSERAEDLLIAETGWHVARNIRDDMAAQMFLQDRQEARRRLSHETTSRMESMRRAALGAGEDALL